jgi:hypothetical protein
MKALRTAVVLFFAIIFSSGCHHLTFREKITTPKVIDGFSSPESVAGSIAKCNTWESRKEGAILSGYGKKRICSPVFV